MELQNQGSSETEQEIMQQCVNAVEIIYLEQINLIVELSKGKVNDWVVTSKDQETMLDIVTK